MADTDNENPFGVVDKRRVPATGAQILATPANYASVTALKARLTAINATSYTAARLATMTKNDMVYALRINDDVAGV